jgi:hypothetical protein
MANNDKPAYNGIGIGGAFTVLFVGLKLAKIIDWSWFWVLSPTLIPLIVLVICLIAIKILDKK